MILVLHVVEAPFLWGSTLHNIHRLPILHEDGWIMVMVTLQLGLADLHYDDDDIGDDDDND